MLLMSSSFERPIIAMLLLVHFITAEQVFCGGGVCFQATGPADTDVNDPPCRGLGEGWGLACPLSPVRNNEQQDLAVVQAVRAIDGPVWLGWVKYDDNFACPDKPELPPMEDFPTVGAGTSAICIYMDTTGARNTVDCLPIHHLLCSRSEELKMNGDDDDGNTSSLLIDGYWVAGIAAVTMGLYFWGLLLCCKDRGQKEEKKEQLFTNTQYIHEIGINPMWKESIRMPPPPGVSSDDFLFI